MPGIEGMTLQIPVNQYRFHYARVTVALWPSSVIGKPKQVQKRHDGVTHNHLPPRSAKAVGDWLWRTPVLRYANVHR